jgi:hypothetical protein
VFTLGNSPSTWGTGPGDAPPSFDSIPPVSLAAARAGQQILLSWPAWATNFNLYSATNLAAPAQWSPVAGAPQSSNGFLYLSLPTTNSLDQYFRLRSP